MFFIDIKFYTFNFNNLSIKEEHSRSGGMGKVFYATVSKFAGFQFRNGKTNQFMIGDLKAI